MRSPIFYKFLSAVLALLLALGGAYAAKIIHDAQTEVTRFRQQEDELQKQADTKLIELQKYQEFYQRMQQDPAFLEYVARVRLVDYAKPEELIYRWDVDALTGATPGSGADGARPPQFAPPTPISHPFSASGAVTSRRNP